MPDADAGLTSVALTRGLIAVAVISAVVIAVRFAWLFTTPYLVRVLDRRPHQRTHRFGARARVVSGIAGFRGAVSLAAALAVPATISVGRPFPDRDLIVFVTSGVIVVTLAQGLLLPAVVRWARLHGGTANEDERRLADLVTTEQALAELPDLADRLGVDPDVTDELRREYQQHLHVLQAGVDETGDPPALRHQQQYTTLRLAMISVKRAAMLELRDQHRIDDAVVRHLQARLDIEELRLNGSSSPSQDSA